MPNWKAVAVGIVAFPVAIVVAVPTGALALFVAGFPSGVLAGYLADGKLKAGLWHAFLVAIGIALLNVAFVVPLLSGLPDTEQAGTFVVGGFLWLFVFVPVWAIECLLGGGAVGAVRWARESDG